MTTNTTTPRPVGRPEPRPIYKIAQEIWRLWKPINYAAKPYAEAMLYLSDIRDHYMMDDGKSIVLYFLSNARTWKGDDAKRIKAELKALVAR